MFLRDEDEVEVEEDGLLDDPPPLSFDPRRFDDATISCFVLIKIDFWVMYIYYDGIDSFRFGAVFLLRCVCAVN